MTFYNLLVFIHVLGGVGVYVALGIEALALPRLQRAVTPADAGLWLRVLALPARLAPLAMIAAFATGAWMTATAWGHRAWIFTTLLGLVGMAIAGGGVTGRALRRLRAALPAEAGAELSGTFRAASASAALTASLRVRVALGLGILGLMTAKPEAAGSALVLAVAALAGLVASVPTVTRRAQAAGPSA